MILAVCMIFLFVDTLLVLGGMENNVLTQKMSAALQAQIVAFNTAEAGIIAAEAKINGMPANLSAIQGVLEYHISADVIDDCQQHILTIDSTAAYQNARIQLTSAYRQARQPSLSGCPELSQQLWWRQES